MIETLFVICLILTFAGVVMLIAACLADMAGASVQRLTRVGGYTFVAGFTPIAIAWIIVIFNSLLQLGK